MEPRQFGRTAAYQVIMVLLLMLLGLGLWPERAGAFSYNIVDTGQTIYYGDLGPISPQNPGDAFFGQDASYSGNQASYTDNGDGTITDNVTRLTWVQDTSSDKSTWSEALAGAETCTAGGYDDWRLPTIKELYSLIDFNGRSNTRTPYIDTDYFDFIWGDEVGGRAIDSQYWSSTQYVGTVFDGDDAAFGVNFADGRIKGYPIDANLDRNTHFVRYVRGDTSYGQNDYLDNGDGTITDLATGLTWMQADSGNGMTWSQALQYAENFSYGGYDDWRLPNAKELQSIVDYTQAPDATGSAAIDPIFSVSEIESYFWSGTTLLEGRGEGVYVAFGQGYGVLDGDLVNVHGAGCQRSDPKTGDPADYADGRGSPGQNDLVRIYNYVRLVRD